MKFKLGLLLGTAGGYLVTSGKARQLWTKVSPSSIRSRRASRPSIADDRVGTIIVDMTTSPLEGSLR